MSPLDISLRPIPSAALDRMYRQGRLGETHKGRPFLSDAELAVPEDVRTVMAGRCECFDLSNADDRIKYGDLRAQIAAGTRIQLVWEERMKLDAGQLLVYITYLDLADVTKTTNIEG